VFSPGDAEVSGAYLICGRLVEPYKRVGMALEAFRDLPHRLRIAGDGPALAELKAAAPPNVEFLGQLDDAALVEEMRSCAALVFPSRDDFGLMPVEAMACGRPVLAYADGGALHTVVPGETGELFAHQTAADLRAALERFDPDAYDPVRIREHALQWDSPRFRERVFESVKAVCR
jgi:glycosyltransferase involved in cell wall biosynthesis